MLCDKQETTEVVTTSLIHKVTSMAGFAMEVTLYVYSIYPKIIEDLHFECVRRSRTHSKCELLLNFRIGSKCF